MPPPVSAGVYTRIAILSPYPRTASHKDALAKLHPTISSLNVMRFPDMQDASYAINALSVLLEALATSTYIYVCRDSVLGAAEIVTEAALANKSFGFMVDHKVASTKGDTALNMVFHVSGGNIEFMWENPDPNGVAGTLK